MNLNFRGKPTLSLKVLIVEDNQTNAFYASRVLERMGCRVVVATTAEEALLKYDRSEFELIMLDIHLPKMDGLAFLKIIRQRELEAGVAACPILVLTADVLRSNRDDCLAAGASGFLSKPIRPEQIYNAVSRVMSH